MRLSVSRIKAFKACRRLFELKYVEHLEPVQKAEALEMGSNYHKLLERLNNGEKFAGNPDWAEDLSKEMAMARAYEKYIYPKFKVVEAEKWFRYDLGEGDELIGCVDGLADDGHIVEHKSYGSEITEEYEYGLQWDEQILAYMLMTGMRKVWYTVCRKPTIRQKQSESEAEFFERMVAWYDEDTDSKIRLLEITRTDAEIEAFRDDLMMMADEMRHAGYFYRNTCHCKAWGRRCEYASVCQYYDPSQQYIEFVKGEEYEPEFTEN